MFLYYIFITPIEKILEWVFYYFIKMNCSVFFAIFGVSIVMNLLALPLYRIADALQKKERDVVRRMEPMVKHIRKAFSGDERFMMLSTYYRQQYYHPLYVIRSSLSILITVPFFIAGYHFLSHCPELVGQKFWIFKDLGSPDKTWVVKIFGLTLTINILPIIMTLINEVSSAIYTQGGTVKEKIQVHALALIFLILLYTSPSGLVIYWILNNLFSLVKNVILEKDHTKVIILKFIGLVIICGKWCKKVWFLFVSFCKKIPAYCTNLYIKQNLTEYKRDFPIFLLSSIGLALLLGFLLPVNVIDTSPLEFSFLGDTSSPLSYIFSSMFVFFGFFVFWPMCIYFMFGDKVKFWLTVIFFTLLICGICNAYIFKPDYGNLNALFLIEESKRNFTVPFLYVILSLLVMAVSIFLFFICRRHHKQIILSLIVFSLCLGMFSLGVYKSQAINTEYVNYKQQKEPVGIVKSNLIEPVYHLSKYKKNVVVIFLDRALGFFVPYIMKEFPQLKEQFDGFTFFPNTVSHGRFTNTGAPAMMGGYEYTPDKIDERSNELLKDKHNEAAMVMPKLFLDASYDVTVTDMPWINYSWEGDENFYKKYPGIHGYNIEDNYIDYYYKDYSIASALSGEPIDVICRNKIVYFSILQVLFCSFRKSFYFAAIGNVKENAHDNPSFLKKFSHLLVLSQLTDFTKDTDTFTFIGNDTTHEHNSLNVPDYNTLSDTKKVNYHGYNPAYKSDDDYINQHYQVNTAALLQLAKWLSYLQFNDVYDNTRIIITSDHGRDLDVNDIFEKFKNGKNGKNAVLPASYNCLYMFKDFNEHGVMKTDNTFMTNADTVFLAKKDLSISNINPFTGKEMMQNKNDGVTVHFDSQWNASKQKKNKTFPKTKDTWHVKDNLFDPNNWTKIENKK